MFFEFLGSIQSKISKILLNFDIGKDCSSIVNYPYNQEHFNIIDKRRTIMLFMEIRNYKKSSIQSYFLLYNFIKF